jgi:pimeloyl-[acyl-carrier protein] synthase
VPILGSDTSAVEEFMRFDGPVPMLARIAHAPITVEEQFFEPGLVSVMLGAANRDPMRFHNPDKLILDRGDNKHLGFGVGHHFCLGAKLARLEGEVAFKTLLAAFPKMRLVNEPLEYHPSIAIRALKKLNVFKE